MSCSELPMHTVQLNGAKIEVYKHSVIFYDEVKEDMFELDWKELYEIAEEAR